MSISREKLIEKKEFYEEKKAELVAKDYSAEVNQEVENFRLEKEKEIKDFEELTIGKYESERQENIKTCDHYLEFVDQLLEECIEESMTETETTEEVVEGGI